MLHNILLHEDHLDDKWDTDDNNEMDEEEVAHIQIFRGRVAQEMACIDKSLVGNYYFNAEIVLTTCTTNNVDGCITDLDYFTFKQYLILHFKYLFDTEQVVWLKK